MGWLNLDFLFIGLVLVVFGWFGKLPTAETLTKLMEVINTRGGNIMLLLFGTILGTSATMRLFYYVIQLSVDGKVMQDNVFALMGLTFLSGTITGGFMGALLKTMTGDSVPIHPPAVKDEADNPQH
jgi:hypothetical protein